MPAEAIGVGDEIARPFAATSAIDGFSQLLDHGIQIVPINVASRHVVAGSAFGEIFFSRRSGYLRAHRHPVVFYDVDARELHEAREVERFVESALIQRAVAEEREAHPAGFFVPRGEGHPGAEW